MEVKKIVEGMTAPQVAQVIDENFNALNGEKATVEAVSDVQKNVNRSDDNTGVLSYPEYSSTEPVAVGDVRRYEGLLYRAKEAGAYDWDPEKWERVTLKQLEDEKLSELGSEVGRGVLTLNLTENHSSTVDVIPVNLKSGDNIVIGIEANSGVKGCSVYFYNSQTGESKPYGLTLNRSTIITVDSDYDEMGLWVEISNEATITMKYYSRSAISSFLNSGVMGIIGSDGGTSYPDVNTKTGEMVISKSMGLIVNGVYISIPPQTFSLKNGVDSSLVKIVLNINTKICTAKIYNYALGANEIVIGTARVKWTSDGSFSELYHVYFPFEYSIDGETVNSKFDSLISDMNNSYFIGDDSKFVSTKFRGFVGRKYKITPIYNTWEIPNDLGNVSIFYIGAHTKSGGNQQLFAANTFSAIKAGYTIEYLEEYNDIYIGGRASKGNKVFFQIEDITEESAKDTFLLVGNDNIGVTAKVLLCKDVEYIVRLPEERWDISNINITYAYYYYELYYTDTEGKTVVLNGNLSNGIYINKFSFVAPETKEYTIYIRANKGVKVPIFILPQISSRHENQLDKARCLGFARNPNSSYIPNLTFMHMSDTHCTNSAYQDSFKKSVTLFNKISGGEKNQGNALKFILHTGDTRNHSFNDGFDFFEKITKELKGNIYITPGNHDVGFGDDATKAGTDEQIYLQMIAPQLNKWQLNSDGTDLPHTEGKNYYFNDFTDEKVRLIVLYEYETDLELMEGNTSKLKYSRDFRAFRQAQIDWFIQTLKNTPQGYGVIIAKHQPESIDGFTDNPFYSNMLTETTHMQSYCGTELIAQIVQAFIDRTVFSTTIQQTGGIVTTLNIVADFSNLASSEFICYCSGHTHLDMITKLKNYPKQIELNIGANNTHYTNGSDIYQNGEGVTELLTNVYSIDRNRGYIYVVRLGANFSNTAQLRDFISLKYK